MSYIVSVFSFQHVMRVDGLKSYLVYLKVTSLGSPVYANAFDSTNEFVHQLSDARDLSTVTLNHRTLLR